MGVRGEGSGGATEGGRMESLDRLARIEVEVSWLVEHWEELELEALLDRIAGVRRDIIGVGSVLLRGRFIEVVSGQAPDSSGLSRFLNLLDRLPRGLPSS